MSLTLAADKKPSTLMGKMCSPSTPSANIFSLALLPVLLLVLLRELSVLLHCLPPQPPTSAGIIANTETKLSIAMLLIPGFRNKELMLFLLWILTWFFFKMPSPARDFLWIQEPPFQFFHRLL